MFFFHGFLKAKMPQFFRTSRVNFDGHPSTFALVSQLEDLNQLKSFLRLIPHPPTAPRARPVRVSPVICWDGDRRKLFK